MSSPAAPPSVPEKPTRASRRRGCLLTGLVILAVLVPGYYWLENWLGRGMLEKQVARYAAAGLSLEPADFLPEPGPSEENFGTTPVLDEMMHEDDGSSAGNAARAKREALSALLPRRGKSVSRSKGMTPVPEHMPQIFDGKPEWDKMRAWLEAYTVCKPPADEPSDARAVFLALEAHRAVFAELVAAARRPHAVFTPAMRERARRLHYMHDLTGYVTTTIPLGRLLELRARAALACGEVPEALAMLRVIWRLREASLGESSLLSLLVANSYGGMWNGVALAILATPGLTDEQCASLAATCGEWSTVEELAHTFRGETGLVLLAYHNNRAEMQRAEAWDVYGGFRKAMVRFGPSGWVDQNMATLLQRRMDYLMEPLRLGGLAALPGAIAAEEALNESSRERWMPSSFLQTNSGEGMHLPSNIYRDFRVRLTLLGIAMERYRLKSGRYPATAAALVPDFIASLPEDMDGAPFRAVTSADGAHCVLYSIGWNLTDDWHGVIPKSWKELEDCRSDDWPLTLPILPP